MTESQHPSTGPSPEELTASTLSILAVGKASANADRFGSWLFGGFAAALTLVLTNRGGIGLQARDLRVFGLAFLAIGAVGVIAKYIATIASATADAARDSLEIADRLPGGQPELILQAMESAIARPARCLVAWRMRRMRRDFLSAARDLSLVVQAQGLLVLFEAACVIGTAVWLVNRVSG